MSSMTFGLNLTLLGCAENVFHAKGSAENARITLLTDNQWAAVTSIFCFGAILSCFLSQYITARTKMCIIANNVFYIAGVLLLFFARECISIGISRLLVGVGIGFTCAYVPLYLEKVSPLGIRGLVCSFHQLFIVLGVLLGQVLSFYFNELSNWRTGIFLALAFVFLHTFLLFLIKDVDTSGERKIKAEKSIIELLKSREARLSIITAIILHSTQQMSCINGVLFYSNSLFEETKYQRIYTIMIGAALAASTGLSMFLVDKYGRKPLLLLSILTDVVSLMFLCILENIVAPIITFVIGFSLGLGPIVWFISSEIFPSEYSHAGAFLASSINWIFTYLVSRYFPILHKSYGNICFSFYSFYLIMSFVYVLGVFKETKGQTPAFQKLK